MPDPTESADSKTLGIVLIDHGSLKPASNQLLEQVVAMFREHSSHTIVEPAHMELATPDIDSAFTRCVEQGATFVVVHPYFLGPGRHVSQDIPRLAAAAAETHNVGFLVTEPLGLHPAMMSVIGDRIDAALNENNIGPS